jgi:hypothetical protein
MSPPRRVLRLVRRLRKHALLALREHPALVEVLDLHFLSAVSFAHRGVRTQLFAQLCV